MVGLRRLEGDRQSNSLLAESAAGAWGLRPHRTGDPHLSVEDRALNGGAEAVSRTKIDAQPRIVLPPVRVLPVAIDLGMTVRALHEKGLQSSGAPGPSLPLARVPPLGGDLSGGLGCRPPREDLDHAAHRVRSVERGEGAADHLDALDVLRRHRGEVVAREVRGVDTHPVHEDQSVGGIRAPQEDRGDGPLASAPNDVQAGNEPKRFKQCGRADLLDALPREDRRGRSELGFLLGREGGRDHDRLLRGGIDLRSRRCGEQENGRRYTADAGPPGGADSLRLAGAGPRPGGQRVDAEQHHASEKIRNERVSKEGDTRHVAGQQPGGVERVEGTRRPDGKVAAQEKQGRRENRQARQPRRVRLASGEGPQPHDRRECPIGRQPRQGQEGPPGASIDEDVGDTERCDRNGGGPAPGQPGARIERKGSEGDSVWRMGDEARQGAEDRQHDRGCHSNLPLNGRLLSPRRGTRLRRRSRFEDVLQSLPRGSSAPSDRSPDFRIARLRAPSQTPDLHLDPLRPVASCPGRPR